MSCLHYILFLIATCSTIKHIFWTIIYIITDYSGCLIHRHAVKYHHRKRRWWQGCHEYIRTVCWWFCAADSGLWFWLRPVWCTVHAVSLPQWECCLSPPRFPCPKTSSPPPSKSAEWESICHTGRHTLRGRRNEHEANDGTGGDGMMVEVKGWQIKLTDEDSWWLIVEVGKKFTWKRRRRKEKQVHGVQTEMRS